MAKSKNTDYYDDNPRQGDTTRNDWVVELRDYNPKSVKFNPPNNWHMFLWRPGVARVLYATEAMTRESAIKIGKEFMRIFGARNGNETSASW